MNELKVAFVQENNTYRVEPFLTSLADEFGARNAEVTLKIKQMLSLEPGYDAVILAYAGGPNQRYELQSIYNWTNDAIERDKTATTNGPLRRFFLFCNIFEETHGPELFLWKDDDSALTRRWQDLLRKNKVAFVPVSRNPNNIWTTEYSHNRDAVNAIVEALGEIAARKMQAATTPSKPRPGTFDI